jgi:hypothetical protein
VWRARKAAERFADHYGDIVGGDSRSVILHGSLAAGGFRPGDSDIDVLAVIDGGLADDQIDALERLVREADLGSATGLDFHAVTAGAAGTPARTPPLELHIGRYPGGVEIELRLAAAPDLPAELSMARADGVALRGAEPRAVIAPVPPQWIVARGRHWLQTWRSLTDDAENAAFMVLTACRIWHFAVTHTHCSKARAAGWALDRNPALPAIRQAARNAPIAAGAIAEVLDTVLRETDRSDSGEEP